MVNIYFLKIAFDPFVKYSFFTKIYMSIHQQHNLYLESFKNIDYMYIKIQILFIIVCIDNGTGSFAENKFPVKHKNHD